MMRKLLLLVCNLAFIATFLVPTSAKAGTWQFWEPTTSVTTSPECNGALSHKEALTVPPGESLQLTVGVSTNLLQPSLAKLHYSLGSGPTLTQILEGSWVTYTFTIAGASLSEGTTIDYAFELVGNFLDPGCVAYTGALRPSRHGFRSVATAEATGKAAEEAGFYAGMVATDQPEYEDLSSQQICNAFFSAPTLCDRFPSSPLTSVPDVIEGLLTPLALAQTQALLTTCTTSNGWTWGKQDESGYNNLGGSWSASVAPAYADKSIVQENDAIANPIGGGASYSQVRGKSGFYIGFRAGTGASNGQTVQLEIRIPWFVKGESQTRAAKARIFTSATSQVTGFIDQITEYTSQGGSSPPSGHLWDAQGAYSATGALPLDFNTVTNSESGSNTVVFTVTVTIGHDYRFLVRLFTTAQSASGTLGAGGSANADYWASEDSVITPLTIPKYKLRTSSITMTVLTPGFYFGSC